MTSVHTEAGRERSVVLPTLLKRNAVLTPDAVAVTFADGTSWTWRGAVEAANGAASTLHELGVGQGDRVALMLPSGPGFLRAWWGASLIGAVVVPINLSYRGDLLWQMLVPARPHVTVVDPGLADRLLGRPAALRDMRVVLVHELAGPTSVDPRPGVEIAPSDSVAYMLTSGTTGLSKLVNTTHEGSFLGGDVFFTPWGLDDDDVFLVDLPLFHAAAFRFVHAAIGARTPIALRSRPSLDAYWEVARDAGVTATLLFGSMFARLASLPVRAAEREHRIRLVGGVPLPADADRFKARFGIEHLHTAWGMTEVPAAIHLRPGIPIKPGSCGVVRDGFEVRLVDGHDTDVPQGSPGEAIVRHEVSHAIAQEYVGHPEATERAWRGGWFHTGDVLRQDADGYYYFVDRDKDVVRRRGENISSFEVEAILLTHPRIAQAACVPVRVSDADEEVKVWVVPADETGVDLDELLLFCVEHMPHFMVPRYFEVAEHFPLTPTGKVEKAKLRATGNGADVWDREAHGYRVTRAGLQREETSSTRP